MIAALLFALAAASLLLGALQLWALRRCLRASIPDLPEAALLPISVLKPLCGLDDSLEANLRSFARLDHPRFEVLLGVRDASDTALPVALAAARRWPHRFRVVLQHGEPGLNPKVNQLITLAAAARHDLLVVSDSNVRVSRSYLREIGALLHDERVGLVTHPVVGVGARTLGAFVDNLILCTNVTPGVAAVKELAGRDIVVGKSMALRRRDLEQLGGFERLKDVLAEDFVSGLLVARELGKRVALAPTPVRNVTRAQSLPRAWARYRRWSVMQRKAVGTRTYAAQVFLHPLLLASLGFAAAPGRSAAAAWASAAVARAALDAWALRSLSQRAGALSLLASPLKECVAAGTWLAGLCSDTVDWRGNRLRVLAGTVLQPLLPARKRMLPRPAAALRARLRRAA